MSESFEVHIAKAEHVFSAAHFITFANQCERLHGHNYHVTAEIAGPLEENHLVIDFLLVRRELLDITSELLAAYIGQRLFDALGGVAAKIERATVKVDECDGQVGVWVHHSAG